MSRDSMFFERLGALLEEFQVTIEGGEYRRGAHAKIGVPAVAISINQTDSELQQPFLLLELDADACRCWSEVFAEKKEGLRSQSPGMAALLGIKS